MVDMKRAAAFVLTAICLLSLSSACSQYAKAQSQLGVITINSDGTINPPTASIQRAGNIFALTNNIWNSSISVQSSNVVLDGAGFTMRGFTESAYNGLVTCFPDGAAIQLSNVKNVTVENFNIGTYSDGVKLDHSSNCVILRNAVNTPDCIALATSEGNLIISNTFVEGQYEYGVEGWQSSANNITGNSFEGGNGVDMLRGSGNIITQNLFRDTQVAILLGGGFNIITGNAIIGGKEGITVTEGGDTISRNDIERNSGAAIMVMQGHNEVFENYIANNSIGFAIDDTSYPGAPPAANNQVYMNDFIGNSQNAGPFWSFSVNYWDNGSVGNYWSDYNGTDADGDGIGDAPYNITLNGADHFPFMAQIDLEISNPSPPPLPPAPVTAPPPTEMPETRAQLPANLTALPSTSPTFQPMNQSSTKTKTSPTSIEVLSVGAIAVAVSGGAVCWRQRKRKKPVLVS